MSTPTPSSGPIDPEQERKDGAHQADVEEFMRAVCARDAAAARRLLELPHVRAIVNDPLFDFGQRALHVAAGDAAHSGARLDGTFRAHYRRDEEVRCFEHARPRRLERGAF